MQKCPSCGYDNADDALSCNLCSIVLRKEKPAAPPPPAAPAAGPAARPLLPGEPADLNSGKGLNDLLLLALKKGTENQFPVAEALMARVYRELSPLTCQELLQAVGLAWLKLSPKGVDQAQALALLNSIAACVGRGDLRTAVPTVVDLMGLVKEPSAEGFKMQLFLLGVKGAATGAHATPQGSKPASDSPVGIAASGGPPCKEPASLEDPERWVDITRLAEHHAHRGDPLEAARLMGRLCAEIPAADLKAVLIACVNRYGESIPLTPELGAFLDKAKNDAAAAAERRDFAGAYAAMHPIVKSVTDPGKALKVVMLTAGLMHAMQEAAKKPSPGPARSDAAAAPPPGAANKPRF